MTSAIGSTSPRSDGAAVRTRRTAIWCTPAVHRRKSVGSTRPEAASRKRPLSAAYCDGSYRQSLTRRRPPSLSSAVRRQVASTALPCARMHSTPRMGVERSPGNFKRVQSQVLPCVALRRYDRSIDGGSRASPNSSLSAVHSTTPDRTLEMPLQGSSSHSPKTRGGAA